MRRIQEVVQALKKPTQQSVFPICTAWQQTKKKNRKNRRVAVVAEEVVEKVLAASNATQRRVERSSGAAQPAASSGVAQPAHDDEVSLKFTSLREVGTWLEILPDGRGNAELRRIQEAVEDLKKLTQQSVFPICAAWQQTNKRTRKNLTVAVLAEELTEKVSMQAMQRSCEESGGSGPRMSLQISSLTP